MRVSSITKNAGKACNNRLYRHIRTFEKIIKNYFVISIKNNEKFDVYSGALEYENEEYSILKIVADNIEGGLQTIQGRMKRYEKDI